MPLRDYRTAPTRAAEDIPRWQGNAPRAGRQARQARQANTLGLAPSLSEDHAATQWEAARDHVIRHARQVYADGPGARQRAALLLVAVLASHVVTCDRCQTCGRADTQTPADWLAWACGRWAPARAVYEPALVQARGAKLTRRPPGLPARRKP